MSGMNDNDLSRLHDLLNRATAPAVVELGASDAEAASLRSGWLGLCRLIEGEERAGQVMRSDAVEAVRMAVEGSQGRATRWPAAWTAWLVAALAASVLIAASMTILVRRSGNGADRDPQQHVAESSTANSADAQRSVAADRVQWGDSVDDEITAVSQATLLAQQDWYAQSSRIGAVQTGLYDLENEIDQGKP
jgi:hypothetical protein